MDKRRIKMYKISRSVTKKDHGEKISGFAKYVDDIHEEGMHFGKMVRSTKPRVKILDIHLPELPEGYYVVKGKDAPAVNRVKVIMDDQPIFAEDEVKYIGEAILMIVGPNQEVVNQLASQVVVDYEELKPVLDLQEATEVAHEYEYSKGDYKSAFENAVTIIEETLECGYRDQAYIEPQGMIAKYSDGKISIHGSMQCPYYVHNAIKHAFGYDDNHVQIVQTTIGGGFGGKEDYPSVVACQAGVAAYKTQKPVKLVFKRKEDMMVTTKDHPGILIYKTALNDKNEIIAMDIEIKLDGGAYPGLSSVVLQRALINAMGVYHIPNAHVHGRVMLTNTVPTGAFRGFGAPQVTFAMETHMSHIARKIGCDVLEFKEKYLVRQGNLTATGGKFREPVLVKEMIEEIVEKSGYREKVEKYKNQSGRYRRGIGIALSNHGCGFTGSAERDMIKAVARLVKYQDDSVEVLVSNTDMGQGLKTTFSKIVSQVLDIPLNKVVVNNPDTSRVPDSGPTVASRSIMVVGKLLERAALRLKDQWETGKYQVVEEHYKDVEGLTPWNMETFSGDAYPTYSWAVNVVEIELDTVTAITELKGVWGVYDVGTPIDETILKGQMQGGLLQGIAYGYMENMVSKDGRIQQDSFTNYIIPTAMDVVNFDISFVDNPYKHGPFGAKGAGELPANGGTPAYIAAVENALGQNINKAPITPEAIMEDL